MVRAAARAVAVRVVRAVAVRAAVARGVAVRAAVARGVAVRAAGGEGGGGEGWLACSPNASAAPLNASMSSAAYVTNMASDSLKQALNCVRG